MSPDLREHIQLRKGARLTLGTSPSLLSPKVFPVGEVAPCQTKHLAHSLLYLTMIAEERAVRGLGS